MSPHLAWRRRFHSGNSFSYWAEISGRSGRGLRWTCRLSGFRATVYGIHFDPWGFGTLLYFVKMVAVFCFNGCREFTFCLCEGASRGGLSYIDFLSTSGIPSSAFGAPLLQGATQFGLSHFRFHTASRIHPPPSARPFSKGLPTSDYLTFAFIPRRRIGFKQSQTFLDDVFYVLPHVFEVVLDVEV